jgi:ABC-type uncharacterized transport system permease subunit
MIGVVSFIIGMSPLFLAYYLAAVGNGFVEWSGVLDLAIDGAFVLSIAVAFAEAVYTGNNIWLAITVAAIASLIFGGLLAFLVTKLPISHGATGLSLMFLGYGLASLIGIPARQVQGNKGMNIGLPAPPDATLATYYYITIIIVGIVMWYILAKTKLGAMIRAAGEDPAAAEGMGVNVLYVRLLAGIVGFALIGIGGAMFDLGYSPVWSQGMGMGQGWIAFAISLSAGRHPLLTWVSAGIFAALINYMPLIQAAYNMPPDVAKMLPFIIAILAMVTFMLTPLKRKLAPPKALGKIYFREERTV